MPTASLAMLPLLLLGSLGLTGAASSGPESTYERVLARAVARAEADLVQGFDLWVDHSSWENAWEVSSEHYTVRTTESRFLATDVADGLEVMLGHFQRIFGTDFVPGQPFEVLIFPRLSDYNTYGDSVGAEHSSALGTFYADQDARLAVATYHITNATLLRMWITHSAAHQYVDRAFQVRLPVAVSEGLASYFALYWDQTYAAEKHSRLKDSPSYIPLGSLFEENLQTFMADPDTRLMELGLFFTYLLHFREDTRLPDEGENEPENSFATYLRMAVRGQDTSQTGFERLLRRDLEALEEDFRAFDFPR